MTAIDDLPDEFEEPTRLNSPAVKKKRKVIGLDDLLEDYYKEKSKLLERESKRAESEKPYASDEEKDVDAREAAFSECVAKCEERMSQMSGDDEMPVWGLQVFGNQETMPSVEFPDIRSLQLFQSFKDHELSSLVQVESEKGETLLEGLLRHGWLSKLVYISGRLEKSIAAWTFNLLLYSSREDLRTFACDFWCSILQPKDEADTSSMIIDWLPTYSETKRALQIYGFRLDKSTKASSDVEMDCADSNSPGPPQNIRHWMKFVAASCSAQRRDMQLIFSSLEVEDLVFVIISLFLDRQLLGLSMMLHESMIGAISSFEDNQWNQSCSRVAKSLAQSFLADVNSLRILESISGVDARSKQLRSAVAFQFLVSCFDEKGLHAEDILRLLIAINLKDKDCDLCKMYIYLNLAENWLSFDPELKKDKPVIREMWGVCLRNCSCLIGSTDMRPFASKVRSKASYLLQGTSTKYSE